MNLDMQSFQNIVRNLLLGFVLFILSTFAAADDFQQVASESAVFALKKEFAQGSILSTQSAELALSKLDQLQLNLQSQSQEKESACLDNFFVNSCLQEVRLKRRELQDILRNISIEAKSFLRRDRAAKSKNPAG